MPDGKKEPVSESLEPEELGTEEGQGGGIYPILLCQCKLYGSHII